MNSLIEFIGQYDLIPIVVAFIVWANSFADKIWFKGIDYDEDKIEKDISLATKVIAEEYIEGFKSIIANFNSIYAADLDDRQWNLSLKNFSTLTQDMISKVSVWKSYIYKVRCTHHSFIIARVVGSILMIASYFAYSSKDNLSCFFIITGGAILACYQMKLIFSLRGYNNYLKDTTNLYGYLVGK